MSADRKDKYRYPVELVLEAHEKKKTVPFYTFRKTGCGEDERALSALLSLITDEDVKYRGQALFDLWMLQGSKAISLMYAFLIDENSGIRLAANRCLSKHADSNDGVDINISFIEKALKTQNADIRRDLISVLCNSKEPQVQKILLECLKDEDSDVRSMVAYKLHDIGDSSAAEPLIRLLSDPAPHVRKNAAYALGVCGNSSAAEPLIKLLSDPLRYIRLTAINALGEIGDSSAIEPVRKIFNEDPMLEHDICSSIVAACALYMLGEWNASDLVNYRMKLLSQYGCQYLNECEYSYFSCMLDDFKNSDLLEALLDMTNDENPDVRNQAVRDLWKYDDQRVHEIYLKIAEDESDPCRETVLNYLDDPAMIDFYLKNLMSDWYDEQTDALLNIEDLCSNNRSGSDSEHELFREKSSTEIKRMLLGPEKKEIMEALSIAFRKFDSYPGTHKAYEHEIVEIIKMFTPLAEEYSTILNTAIKAHNHNIRFHAAMKLADVGRGIGLHTLIDILSETIPAWLRWDTVEYLALRKDPKSVKPLIKLLMINDEKAKWFAAEVLGHLNDDLAVDPLIQLLEDSSKWVRAAAAKALGELEASSSIESLIKLLYDDSEYPRFRAVEALGRVGDIGALPSLKIALKDECYHVQKAALRAISEIIENF